MLERLQWSGRSGFVAKELHEWVSPTGEAGGETKTCGGLTYFDIRDAGHMVSRRLSRGQLGVRTR